MFFFLLILIPLYTDIRFIQTHNGHCAPFYVLNSEYMYRNYAGEKHQIKKKIE